MITFGISNRCTQIAFYGYNVGRTEVFYFRRQHDNNVTDWQKVITQTDLVALLTTDANLAIDNRPYRIAGVSSNVAWSGIGMGIIANKFTDSLVTQLGITNEKIPRIAVRNFYENVWSGWEQIITKSFIQRGTVLITPTSVNTPEKYALVFPTSFSSVPTIVVTPNTGVAGVTASISDVTKTGCNIWLTRPNIVTTSINWIATNF